jgi:hypothetical protein
MIVALLKMVKMVAGFLAGTRIGGGSVGVLKIAPTNVALGRGARKVIVGFLRSDFLKL